MNRVVFDLDGTLIESAPAIQAVGDRMLADMELAPLTLAETKSYVGNGAAKFVERALAARNVADPDQLSAAISRFHALYETADPLDNAPMPGAEACLRVLHARGHPVGLCTNKPEAPTRKVIDALGWTPLFAAVVAGDTLAVKKPDPGPLLETIARLGGGPAVFVGDSDVDAETAARAGVPFLLYTEGYRKSEIADLPHAGSFGDYTLATELIASSARATDRSRP